MFSMLLGHEPAAGAVEIEDLDETAGFVGEKGDAPQSGSSLR
jgi:hypothetical protein